MGGAIIVIIIIIVVIVVCIALCVLGGFLVTILTTMGLILGGLTSSGSTSIAAPSQSLGQYPSHYQQYTIESEEFEPWFVDRDESKTEEQNESQFEGEGETVTESPSSEWFEDGSDNGAGGVSIKEYGPDCKTTILVFMNGSDLETDDGMATADLTEMASAVASDQVNIVIETLGTTSWQTSGISGETAERFQLKNGSLTQLQTGLGKVSPYDPETLTDFIQYGTSNFPADRYFLILWDHGGGPVYGYGYDLWSEEEEALTASELKTALKNADVHFDMIGFDACIMGCLEISSAVEDHADYLVASEDFESGFGWEYQNWLTSLSKDPGMPTASIGAIICDDFTKESKDAEASGILALMDLSQNKNLREAWLKFAYAHKEELLKYNYSSNMTSEENGRVLNHTAMEQAGTGFLDDLLDMVYSLDSYGALDLMAAARNLGGEGSQELIAAFTKTVIYCAATEDETNLAGISVTLPYGDAEMYSMMNTIYPQIGFDDTYVAFLSDFTEVDTGWYDYGDYSWDGWDFEDGDYSFGGYNEDGEWEYNEEWFREILGDEYYDEYGDYFKDFFEYFGNWDPNSEGLDLSEPEEETDEYDIDDLLNDLQWLFE